MLKKSIKRAVALGLVLCTMNISTYAVEFAETGDKIVETPTERCFLESDNVLFDSGTCSTQLTPNYIDYAYDIENKSDDSMANVKMDVILNYAWGSKAFEVAGEIPVFKLPTGVEYMYGPLEGEVSLGGNSYDAIVGFQKMGDSADISATLTLKCDDTEAIFKFGGLHVKYNIVEDVLPAMMDIASMEQTSTQEMSEGDYQYMTAAVARLNDKIAIKETISYYAGKRRLMLTATPYLQNIEDIHTISGTATAAVSVNRVKLKIAEKNESQTIISGLVFGGTTSIGESGGTVSGYDVLDAISAVGALKYPTQSTALSAFLALVKLIKPIVGTKASFTKGADIVSAEYANINLSDKSWDQHGVSLACQLLPINTSLSTMKAAYNYWSEIRYSITVTDFTGDVSHVYRTAEVSKDYTITTA